MNKILTILKKIFCLKNSQNESKYAEFAEYPRNNELDKSVGVFIDVYKDCINHQYNGDDNLISILVPIDWAKKTFQSIPNLTAIYATFEEMINDDNIDLGLLDSFAKKALEDNVIMDYKKF